MSDFTVTIVGAGVIGTSLGLAIKQSKDPPRLLAHDKDLGTAKAATQVGAFDKAEWNLVNACEQAEVIILAIPLGGIRPTLEAIAPYLKEGAIVSDTARSKAPALAWAKELLPDTVHFIGGDPVVTPPGQGYENARADLFRNRLYCLTPTVAASEEALQFMVGLVRLIGSEPFFLDAEEHDGLVTATEHLPRLLSAALVNTLVTSGSWRESRKLAGFLFEQVSAGASGDPDDLTVDFLSSRAGLIRWLDRYMTEMAQLRRLIQAAGEARETNDVGEVNETDEADEALAQHLDQAVVARQNWLLDTREGRFIDPELVQAEVETTSFWKRWIGFGR